ncbi:MAG: helicase, superfamily, partial [Devosia sp.]|uniref:SNF2-related protein n=1 Tax=Devosia sp. TaxID=1871048 RepID=UPI002608831F
MTTAFVFSPSAQGGTIALIEKRMLGPRPVPVDMWHTAPESLAPAVRYLKRLIDSGGASIQGTEVTVTTDALLSVPASIATLLQTPAIAPLSLSLSLNGRVETSDGAITASWYDTNFRRLTPKRTGMFVGFGQETGRLATPVYHLLEAIDAYNATLGQPPEQRLPSWLAVQQRLEPLTGTAVKADKILQNLRIYQAGAFALDIKQAVGAPIFDPVLMVSAMRASLEDETIAPEGSGGDGMELNLKDNEEHALLAPHQHAEFLKQFNADGLGTRPSYVVARNTYLVIEPELQSALNVVKRLRRAPDSERRAFLRNPRTYIAEALPDAGEAIGTIFVETRQYSERVVGLGIWEKPKLDWLMRKGQGWLPERFVLRVGSKDLEVDAKGVEELAAAADSAASEGREDIRYRGETFSKDDVDAALARLRDMEAAPPHFDRSAEEAKLSEDRNVLLMNDNIEETGFAAGVTPRPLFAQKLWPSDAVRTVPKPHQTTGFGWLVDAWTSGLPGALLADDMGLGKTMQALAFLAWFRSNRHAAGAEAKRFHGPILIVAPTALLRNWQKEAETHLVPDSLGECVEVFGSGLNRLKARGPASPEDALDVSRLRDSDWILTTYETLANFHRAFARVAYSVAIFDEMQKIKAPDTINTHAAKVMNADFVLGMTGTPIENRIEDI